MSSSILKSWASLVAQMVKKIHLQCRRSRFNPWVRKIPWRRKWLPTAVFLPGEPHGQRSRAGYYPWGYKEWMQLSNTNKPKSLATMCHVTYYFIKNWIHCLQQNMCFLALKLMQYLFQALTQSWIQVRPLGKQLHQ